MHADGPLPTQRGCQCYRMIERCAALWGDCMGSLAAIFVRRTGADGTGHVGWAFACHGGIFCAGSVENPRHTLRTRPEHMGFWTVRTHDPIAPMRERAYNEFKVIDLDRGNSIYAW